MDWTILLNACASALGGTATAIIVIGGFGNKLFDLWFKKGYKKWESELDQGLKVDFKRIESKIDAVSDRQKTMFETAHPKRLDASFEIMDTARSLQRSINRYMMMRDFAILNKDRGNNPYLASAEALQKELNQAMTKYIDCVDRHKMLFTSKAMVLKMEQLTKFVAKAYGKGDEKPFEIAESLQIELSDELRAIENYFKSVLGLADAEQ